MLFGVALYFGHSFVEERTVSQQSKTFISLLTDEDRIVVRMRRSGRHVLRFSVQYEALINGQWHKITRFDNAHGYPHRHVYHPHRQEYKHPMSTTNNNQAFTEAQMVLKKNFMGMRERYILALERKIGGTNHE